MAKKWSALTRREKTIAVLVSVFGVFVVGSFANAVNQPPATLEQQTQQVQNLQPEVTYKEITETENVPYEKREKEDASLETGVEKVTTKGVKGILTKTYRVTYTDGIETARELIDTEQTREPVDEVITVGTYVAPSKPKPASNCDENYSGCVPIASDVDCGGGSGDGPAYLYGTVNVIGYDIYDLDRDNDGLACE